jgi:hypothetical protein
VWSLTDFDSVDHDRDVDEQQATHVDGSHEPELLRGNHHPRRHGGDEPDDERDDEDYLLSAEK